MEGGLPSTLDPATIYAVTDSGETEIEKLIIRGMEFAGGGVPDTGEPMISSPSNGSTINLGDNTAGQGVSKTITIKGKNLTGDITVAVGTGLTISYGQSTGQSSVTIPMAQALLGAQVTIAYSGTGALDDGSLVIRQGNDVLSSVVVVVVVVPVPTTLTAIKMTGTQWLQTDYKPNANTEFELDVKFSGFSSSSSSSGQIMFDCTMNTIADTAKLFRMYYTGLGSIGIKFANEESITNPNTHSMQNVSNDAVNGVRGIIKYVKESGHGTFSCGSSSVETTLKSSTMENALKIGHGRTNNAGADAISNFTEFVIYGFVITENGTTVRNYVPAELDGEAGLYDTITGAFHTSATSSSIIGIE